jgi:hypothetical protein
VALYDEPPDQRHHSKAWAAAKKAAAGGATAVIAGFYQIKIDALQEPGHFETAKNDGAAESILDRPKTGLITPDSGYGNTGSCQSANTLSTGKGNGSFPESVSRDEVMRPERPKRECRQGSLPLQSPASRTEGSVIEAVRRA